MKAVITKKGTVLITDNAGKEHEGYVNSEWADQEVELYKHDGKMFASNKGKVRQVEKYTGQKDSKKINNY